MHKSYNLWKLIQINVNNGIKQFYFENNFPKNHTTFAWDWSMINLSIWSNTKVTDPSSHRKRVNICLNYISKKNFDELKCYIKNIKLQSYKKLFLCHLVFSLLNFSLFSWILNLYFTIYNQFMSGAFYQRALNLILTDYFQLSVANVHIMLKIKILPILYIL